MTCEWCHKEEVCFEIVVYHFHRGNTSPSPIPGRQGIAFTLTLCRKCLPFRSIRTKNTEKKLEEGLKLDGFDCDDNSEEKQQEELKEDKANWGHEPR